MSVDVQWIVIGFPVWFLFCVVQVESNIWNIYNVQIYFGGSWFGNINDKDRHSFISFDTVDFYPSISEKLLNEALAWASDLATITENDISIIKRARKSLLFGNGKLWTKKDGSNSLFDVTMGSFDGAEI